MQLDPFELYSLIELLDPTLFADQRDFEEHRSLRALGSPRGPLHVSCSALRTLHAHPHLGSGHCRRVSGIQEPRRVVAKLEEAASAAEHVGLPFVGENEPVRSRFCRIDSHRAHRVLVQNDHPLEHVLRPGRDGLTGGQVSLET
jgi:hypothetical protein